MWSALVLGLTTSLTRLPACDLAGLDQIRGALSRAYLSEDFDRALELAECEVRALQGAPPWLTDPDDGTSEHLCKPLEIVFNICNEHRPVWNCAEATLARHVLAGCSEMPGYAAEHHRMRAQYHHRRFEYGEEFVALAAAADRAEADAVLGLDDGADAWLELAIAEAQRGQLAADLRGWHVARASVAAADDWLARAQRPNLSAAAEVRNLLAWSMLLAREGGGDVGDPTPQLIAALTTFEALNHRAAADNVRINLGLAAFHRGDHAAVEAALADVHVTDLDPEQALWMHMVRLRTDLAAGRTGRLGSSLRALERLARGDSPPTARYHVAWSRGLVHEAAGRLAQAARAYEEAEAVLEGLAHGPLASQDSATVDRAMVNLGDAARRLVGVQARLGNAAAAARGARLARTRALRVAARESCPISERVRDDPPTPGHLRLLYFPASPQAPTGRPGQPDAWVGFAITSEDVRFASVELPSSAPPGPREELGGWSTQLLEPFRAELARASEVEVLPTGVLHEVPFHELPWDGDILLAARPVRYGLDLETCGGTRPLSVASAQILYGPETRDFDRETRRVHDALKAAGYAPQLVQPSVATDLAGLLDDPPRLVHIAAHGEQPVHDRLFLADDRVRFADGLGLTRADILAAKVAPELVFFSSCRASAVDAETLGGGLSLAQAFVVRGARFVVGATADLDGEVATAFAPAFYGALAGRPIVEAPAAWREAYLETRIGLAPRRRHLMRMLRLFAR